MGTQRFTLFETPIGRCGVAWSEDGILCLQLPEQGDTETCARLQRRFPSAVEAAPSREIQRVARSIQSLLRGEAVDLGAIALDMSAVPPFHKRVYEAARRIPPGRTLSYGELAARAGAPRGARAVGQALGKNPFAIIVPCHRVFAAGGKVGGFSARGGVNTKLRLLELEGGAPTETGARLFADELALGFDRKRAVRHLRSRDPRLARLIDRVGPLTMQLKRTPSLFAALAEAIVYQQLHGKAAATIFGRVCALFPRSRDALCAEDVLRATDEQLRQAGLSRSKLASLRDLARRASAGEIPTLVEAERLENDVLIEKLTEVRGVGRWTVEMLLMFRLGRPDVLPADDYGVRKGFAVAFGKRELPTPKDLARYGERWAPFRTAASWYLWRAAELDRA